MRLRLVAHVNGLLLRAFGVFLLVPMLVDWGYGNWDSSIGFLIAALSAVVFGELAQRMAPRGEDLQRLEGIMVVASAWLVVSLFSAIPYLWHGMSVIDSLFESMSGLTATGATILTDFSRYSEGLFLWRSLTQWFGGMGVIALFIAVLPRLAIAGRQMFFAEAPGPQEERLTPRIRHTAIALWSLYISLTVIQIIALITVGIPAFDAVCNSLTTVSAGGFSPNPQSIGGYANPAAEWIFVFFIFLAGTNYSLQYRAIRGRPLDLFRDEEFRAYTLLVIVATLLLTYFLLPFNRDPSPEYLSASTSPGILTDAPPLTVIRQAAFQVLTIVTGTGLSTDDYNLWSDQARVVLLILMFIGGSAGSAAAGPKVVRVLLIFKYSAAELVRVLHPRALIPVRFNRRVVPPKVLRSIVTFLLLYILVFIISVILVAMSGTDILTAITASIATLGNIGPGLSVVGPMGTYADFPAATKVVLFLNMWIGRLEVITVLVLLQPAVWRSLRSAS